MEAGLPSAAHDLRCARPLRQVRRGKRRSAFVARSRIGVFGATFCLRQFPTLACAGCSRAPAGSSSSRRPGSSLTPIAGPGRTGMFQRRAFLAPLRRARVGDLRGVAARRRRGRPRHRVWVRISPLRSGVWAFLSGGAGGQSAAVGTATATVPRDCAGRQQSVFVGPVTPAVSGASRQRAGSRLSAN
jgi:hypothetical protein